MFYVFFLGYFIEPDSLRLGWCNNVGHENCGSAWNETLNTYTDTAVGEAYQSNDWPKDSNNQFSCASESYLR